MTVIDLITAAQFVVDHQGHKKAVLLEVTVWEEIVAMLERSASEVDTSTLEVTEAEAETQGDALLASEASQNLLDQSADEVLAEVEAGQAQHPELKRSGFAALPDKTQASANQNGLARLHSLNKMGDKQEQQQTWAYLQQAVDKDRLSDRPLFIE